MQLTDGKDLYHLVLNAPIGIAILNAATLVTEIVNDKFLEVAGKPREAIFGQFYWEAFAEARPYYETALAGVVETGEAYYADEVKLMLIRHGREEMIFVTFVYAPVKDKDGKVKKIAVWVLENTKQVAERQKIEAARMAFQLERDRLKNFFMQAPAGICILTGPKLIYELVNPAYQQLLPGRELLNRPIFEALPELVGTPLQQVLLNVYNTGESYQINELLIPVAEYEGGPTHDRYFTFNYLARRDENDQIDGLLAFVYEVTGMIGVQYELQKAREQSDKQKRVYETITSGTPDLMYVWDLDYRFTYANSALLSMWGKNWDTAIGKSLLENGYEPWHAEMHEREIDHVVATRQTVRGEVSFPHATLGKRIYDYILIPVLDEKGEVEAVAGTTRDVTERKIWEETLAQSSEELQSINEEMATSNEELASTNEELSATNEELESLNQQLHAAQQKIEESEAALRLAINAADFGTWFIHSGTRNFITDARLKELFGYYPDEPLSIEQALAQITEEYRGFVSNKLESAINNNGDYDVTYPVIGLHDQRLRWLRAIGNLKADPSGTFSAFTGVVMDITEQYLAAQKIEESEKHFRYLADLVPAKISNALPNGEVTFFNRQWLDYAGMCFEDLRDFGYHAMMHPDEIPDFVEQLGKAAAKGMALESEMRFKDINGNYRWHLNIASPILNDKGEITMWVGSTTDIQRIKEEDQRKSDFIGMVSHELKTPLTSLNAYLQVMQGKFGKSDDQFTQRSVEQSLKQVKKMTAMINGFLNVSRLESGQILIHKTPFDIPGLFAEIQAEINPMNTTHTIDFTCHKPTLVLADRDKIGQVLNNLLSNAVKYSKAGSNILVNCLNDETDVILSVRDQGIGIKHEDLNYVFERYFRAEIQGHISGFGIGLYLCAEIIKRHEGKIWAESEPGKGSTFYFSLPLTANEKKK